MFDLSIAATGLQAIVVAIIMGFSAGSGFMLAVKWLGPIETKRKHND